MGVVEAEAVAEAVPRRRPSLSPRRRRKRRTWSSTSSTKLVALNVWFCDGYKKHPRKAESGEEESGGGARIYVCNPSHDLRCVRTCASYEMYMMMYVYVFV